MKSFLRVLLLAVGAAAIEFLIMGALMVAGIGPHGRAMQILASGAMASDQGATSRAWFQAAEQSVMLDRFVLWPTTFLLASLLYVRFVPNPRWWHCLVIACAVLPLSVPSASELAGLHIPGSSRLSPWVGTVTELLAYALLVGVFSYVLRKLRLRQHESTAAA